MLSYAIGKVIKDAHPAETFEFGTVDVNRGSLHLGRTNTTHLSYILAPLNIFRALQRQSLYDGCGLLKRQAFSSSYRSIPTAGLSCDAPDEYGDEDIKVYLYNVKCDAAGALPCVRCGINICEEGRF
ncbi:hypothetical protein EDB81DRAFT_886344 [Dactylonectria macrodidyma]|uniref:Uncharacterized protein n=1 Tax=Dactylonectria macrodidyma TaxID=307937 RepID=A0A9P9EDA9_9HYPO|nr:hypothetical protein EDB81DRAFT_886344 [Dactylonectria macrodidyma]